MDKKEPKFKIGQRVFLNAEVYEKGEGNIPLGSFEILEIYCGGNDYFYFLKPEMEQPECVIPPYVYDEKWLISLSENNVGKGIEKPIKCVEESRQDITPRTVNILGTDYTVVEKPIKDCDGYCDKTTKEIAVAVKEDDCDLGNFEEYRKKVLRHEVIHAYHYESGLSENFENKQYGFSETLVDWFAYQSPKIFKTFEELGIL